MLQSAERLVLDAFSNAAKRVPAYQVLLREAEIRAGEIRNIADFRRLPILDKHNTFQRFGIHELCQDGVLGRLGTVLTSSGHSGIFAFGLSGAHAFSAATEWIDDALDFLFAVRTRPTLLINCLPMGVKVPTQACTLAETSVRSDMVVGLVRKFAPYFDQLILVGEAAFVKLALESGVRSNIEWRKFRVHLILGEESLAENARRYLGSLLGHDIRSPERGIIFSSMGVAELGLNIFFEVPPVAPLILLRRSFHDEPTLRKAALGSDGPVPALFTYDPKRVFVEFDASSRLILTTLDLGVRVPLIRYATGDWGNIVSFSPDLKPAIEACGVSWETLESLPIVAISGRGNHALAGEIRISPEAIKEGIYHEPALAELTTANFRLISGPTVVVRIQLAPGVSPKTEIQDRFLAAISHYVPNCVTVVCEAYEDFGDGMALDYERKFQYLGGRS